MVGYLLDSCIPFIHVKLGATTQPRKTLSVTVVVAILSCRTHRHVHHVKIQIATTRRSIVPKIDVHRECLALEVWLVEIVSIAVVCCWSFHEIEPVRWSELDCLPTVDDGGAREIVSLHLSILINCQGTSICSHEGALRAQIRLAVQGKGI